MPRPAFRYYPGEIIGYRKDGRPIRLAGGGAATTDFLTQTGDTSYTVPPGVFSLQLDEWEAGAGGAATGTSGSDGGGGGAHAQWLAIAVSPGQSLAVSIPAGGAGGVESAGSKPSARVSVTIGGTTYTVSSSTTSTWAQPGTGSNSTGGAGGTPNPSPAAHASSSGGAGGGGNGSGLAGAGGGSSGGLSGNGNAGVAGGSSAGAGGAAPDSSSGAGGAGGATDSGGNTPAAGQSLYDGNAGNAPDPGGGGGGGGNSNALGGDGAAGQVAFTWTPVLSGHVAPYAGGQAWQSLRRRRRQQALSEPPPPYGSFALAPLAFSGTGTVAAPPPVQPYAGGQAWQSLRRRRRQQALSEPPPPYGGFALAPLAFSGTGTVYTEFPASPLGIAVELLINGTWTDITSFVLARDDIVITRGRPDETQQVAPCQAAMTLANRDGRFSLANPAGAYYPFIGRNTQLRVSVTAASQTGDGYSGFRFWGEVSSLVPGWDETGTDVYVKVTASGPLRRYSQGQGTIGSALRRYYTGLSDDRAPYGYWPCEDASGATEFASYVPGVPAMGFTGSPGFSSDSSFGGSDSIPSVSGSSWHGQTGAAADPPGTGSLTQATPGTYTFRCPPGVTSVDVEQVTGGGGGGGAAGPDAGGGGGGGAGTSLNASVGVTEGNDYEYVVGAGGAPGTAQGTSGQPGGTSSWTGDTQAVTGGGGGAGAGGDASAGGDGGTGTYPGGDGGQGQSSITTAGSLYVQGNTGATGLAAGGTAEQLEYNWLVPDGVTSADVALSGGAGGGAGGGQSSDGAGGGGGGGAGFTSATVVATAGDTLSIKIGDGGNGGESASDGQSGADSVFTGSSGPGINQIGASGGAGGTASGGAGGAGGGPGLGGTSGSAGGGSTRSVTGEGMGGGGGGGGGGQDNGTGGNGGEPGDPRPPGAGGGNGAGGGWGAASNGGSGSTTGSTGQPGLSGVGAGGGGGGGALTNTSGKAGGGGGGGWASWSWTATTSAGGGGGGSGGTSSAGNPGTDAGAGGAAVTGGGAGGNQGAAGTAPGGGGGGGVPANSVMPAITPPGAGAAGLVSFSWSGGVTSPVAADIVRFLLEVDAGGGTDGAVLARIITYGTAARMDLVYHSGGNLELIGYDGSNSVLFDSGSQEFGANGTPMMVDIELTASGANATWTLSAIQPDAGGPIATFTGTADSVSVGYVSDVYVSPNSDVTFASIGQVSVQTYADPLTSMSPVIAGYDGELAADRLARLAGEENLSFTLVGNASDTPQMGPQQDDTFTNVLQSCEDLDRGQLFESRDSLGLSYRTRVNLQGQNPVLTLDYSAGELSPGLEPTDDDQYTRNDITLTRNEGSSTTAVLTAGAMSVLPPPNGVGDYSYQLTVYAFSDAQLAPLAAWILAVGTVADERYPVIPVELARAEVAALLAVIAAVDVGDFVQIARPPAFLTSVPIAQLAWGFTETLGNFTTRSWRIGINAVPESPYSTGNLPTW